ncbi:DUF3280 domain-containing protein [Amaricoccus solimangrovi]|uniref:DUF2380 domain-containing protein n=1 Tax=Amaricoccus solimangrovi TaxID=2589815 RepID=A0A501X0E4_9RHOB|nr:DUF3280 domain-containing protein [Amaricoccus solimangrovi]TPE52136.1 DUF2380 domain-containing protein [Amaricoccus solimangrovi]
MTRLNPALILALTFALVQPAAAEELWQGRSAAFFGAHWIDTSTEGAINGPRADETARVRMLDDYIAEGLRAGGLTLVDLGPAEAKLAAVRNPEHCNGCDVRIARELGADYSVVAEVQKVSNLILAINIYVRDAATGAQLRGQAVDIRGNTDESWRRGARYILRNNIFAQ